MAANTIRLKDFPIKAIPADDDIVYLGDSGDSFNEVQTTVSTLISGYSPALASIAGLTTLADQMLYTTAPDTYAVTSITAFSRDFVSSVDAIAAQLKIELVPGVNIQEYSVALTSIAGLTTASNQMIYTTGADTYAVTTITSFGRSFVAAADATAAKVLLSLTPGTDVQPYSLALTNFAALSFAADKIAYSTGAGTFALTDFESFGRSLAGTTSQSNARTVLNLVPGSNLQIYSPVLTSLAALSLSVGQIIYTTGTGLSTFSAANITAFGRALIASVDAAAAQSSLLLVPGTNVQAYSAALASIAGLTTLADRSIYTTSSNTYAVYTLTAFGRTLASSADAAAARASLGITPGATFTWTEVTGTSQAIAIYNGYIANNVAQVTFTMPAAAAVGDVFEVVGKGAGGWKINQLTGQSIHIAGISTTTGTGGLIASTNRYNCIKIICITANTEFTATSVIGNPNLT